MYSIRILKMRDAADFFVVAAGQHLQTYNLRTLELVKSIKLNSPIRLINTSKQSIALVLEDGTVSLVDATTLENRQQWKWSDLKKVSTNATTPRILIVSPDDRFLVLHAGSWNIPTIIVDRQSPKIFAEEVRISVGAFDANSPNMLYTWFSPEEAGG